MNNTHYAIMNEEHTPIAVIRKRNTDDMMKAIMVAISEETGESIDDITKVEKISFNDDWNFPETIEVRFDEESVYRYDIVPTWEY